VVPRAGVCAVKGLDGSPASKLKASKTKAILNNRTLHLDERRVGVEFRTI
jgi:hypothetical protein